MMSTGRNLASRRRRFVTLDAMRGVAAISVMLFHFLHFTPYHIFNHAFYAVDFFFILSGIVLFHSYGGRITVGMGFDEFCRIRLVRLYPFYLIGLLLGVASLPLIIGFSARSYILSAVCNLLFLPFLNHADVPFVHGYPMLGAVFPYNIPAWSLFFEALASMGLYALIRFRINLPATFGVAFCGMAVVAWHFHTVNVGWSTDDFLGGLPRTIAAFTFGMMMYRFSMTHHKVWPAPSVPVILLGMVFMLPLGQALGLLTATVCIPVLLYLGISADPLREQRALLIWLGRVSYGIYAIHLPVYHLLMPWLAATPIGRQPLVLAVCLVIIVLIMAHLLTALVDEPVRRWLTQIRQRRPVVQEL